ncbi:MAG: ComEA family DNA-binding protein, partial [Campylobacterota bacterium]
MLKIISIVLALALTLSAAVNINTAEAEKLQELQGIGEVKAERIVEYRKQNGPFESASQLTEVKGIG